MSRPSAEYIETYVEGSNPKVNELVKLTTTENDVVIFSTKDEDKLEHWDFKINLQKYDLKELKKLKRSDPEVCNDRHWMEFMNGDGFLGWLYSSPDVHIILETPDAFLYFEKEMLISYVEERIEDIGETKAITNPYYMPETSDHIRLYIPYHRAGRQDSIASFPIKELQPLAYKFVKKP